MALVLATLVPVALVLCLLLFGDYGSHRAPAMTPGRVIPVLVVAFLLGPLPALLFGFAAWLVLVAVIVVATLTAAAMRQPPLRH
jgi:hypothetical protein